MGWDGFDRGRGKLDVTNGEVRCHKVNREVM